MILDLERQVGIHRAALLHLAATLKLLNPTIKPHVIRAKHRMADRSGYFALGELAARCLYCAREAGEKGIAPVEIADKTMRDKGLDPATKPCGLTSCAGSTGRWYSGTSGSTRSGTARECGGGCEAKRWAGVRFLA